MKTRYQIILALADEARASVDEDATVVLEDALLEAGGVTDPCEEEQVENRNGEGEALI